jgi:hypothetical protein
MAVSKGDVRRSEVTERILFVDCHATVGKGFFFLKKNRISLPTALMGGW